MPFQMAKCEGCGEVDYVEDVLGHWLCRYCRETLEEEGHIVLENGKVLWTGSAFVCTIRLDERVENPKELAQILHEFLDRAGYRPRYVDVGVAPAAICPECGYIAIEVEGGMGERVRYCLSCGHRF